ncbi:MAG: discoidin domain-containing protein [Acidobacteriota bacterium]
MRPAVCCLVLFLALLAADCKKEAAKAPPVPAARETAARKIMAEETAAEDANLLGFAHGAVVAERTGELNLEDSAVQAIDGTPGTVWVTPPSDPQQSLTVVLAAPSQITAVGYTAVAMTGAGTPQKIQFDASSDGTSWTPLKTIESPALKIAAMQSVDPANAAWIRVSFPEESGRTVGVASLLAAGREVGPYRRPDITGSWSINGLKGLFLQSGSRVHGTVAMSPPMTIEGGWNGRTIPFAWTRGPQYGLGVLGLSADGKYLNGEWWYEEAIPLFYGTTWFGEKLNTYPDVGNEFDVPETWLQRFGHTPVYSIVFSTDDKLDVTGSEAGLRWVEATIRKNAGSKLTLISRNWAEQSEAGNIASGKHRLDSLRTELSRRRVPLADVTFEALGPTHYKEHPAWNIYQPVFNRIELQVARSMKE